MSWINFFEGFRPSFTGFKNMQDKDSRFRFKRKTKCLIFLIKVKIKQLTIFFTIVQVRLVFVVAQLMLLMNDQMSKLNQAWSQQI